MNVKESITKLTDEELSQQLKLLKQDIGPVLPSTRLLYEKRLLKCLLLEKASSCTITYSNTDTSFIEKPIATVADKTENYVSAKEDGLLNCFSYFGVQLPPEVQKSNDSYVFGNKDDAIKFIKEKKGGRFKAFNTRSEAEEFSRNCTAANTACNSPKGNMVTSEFKKPLPSESSAFKSLKFQELLPLKRAIESEDLETIRSLVWSNPRYLIGNGDSPTVLQEGSRYNALHICANQNKPEACKMILETIQDLIFAQLLYPDDTEKTRLNRIEFFTDLYLNTPDKRLGETPLHFACKHGNVEMVAVLIAHPYTEKELRNVEGKTAKDVICARINNAPSDLIRNIVGLFENHYYVQVVGSVDNSFPAKIIPPSSPSVRPAKDNGIRIRDSPTPSTPGDLPVSLKASAGPMSAVQAQHFHSLWVASPGSALSKDVRKLRAQIRRGDCSKGLERIGREISRSLSVQWREYWDFLDCHIDLDSAEGLKKLEDYLQNQKELNDAKLQEEWEQDRLKRQDMSICEMLRELQLSEKRKSEKAESSFGSGPHLAGTSDVVSGVVQTWPPSYSKVLGSEVRLPENGKLDRNKNCKVDDKGLTVSDDVGEDVEISSVGSKDSFHTADDDVDLEYSDATEWIEDELLFIYGDQPCKTDLDVFRAIESTELSRSDYPLVFQWRKNVMSFDEDVRNRWVPRDRLKHAVSPVRPVCTSTPSHDLSLSLHELSISSQSDDDVSSDFNQSVRIKLWQ